MTITIELENVKWLNSELPNYGEITLTDCPSNAKTNLTKVNEMIMKSFLENVGELPLSYNIKNIF